MFSTILAGLRRFFGIGAAPPETVRDLDAPPADWWIPKDREALAAAQLAKRREALIEKLAAKGQDESPTAPADAPLAYAAPDHHGPEADPSQIARAETDAAPPDAPLLRISVAHGSIVLNAEQFATTDDVESLLAAHRREKAEEQQRIESIEIPQAMMMDDQEYAVAQDWMLDHRSVHPLPKGEIYGQYWVRFGRSSLGDTATVGCSTCGRSKVLTELSVLTEPFVRRDEAPRPKHG
ncbi:MAG: hypothetical protein JWO85_740 [Candidatus Eremiobacteraeota bacterium]|jgi:hypothetical protein|nr:hypothetical protein [Candidatus Eremiobacteraeota bacterium]